jgi:hypothetical protein
MLGHLAFPNDGYREGGPFECRDDAAIAPTVASKLRAPEGTVPRRQGRTPTSRVMMPEAAMHEDGPPLGAIRDVG